MQDPPIPPRPGAVAARIDGTTVTTDISPAAYYGGATGAYPGTAALPGTTPRRWLAGLRRRISMWLERIGVRRAIRVDARDVTLEDGLHRITRPCETWFIAEFAQIEKDAIMQAHAAAAANLPRIDIAYEELPEEAGLAARCRGALHGWADRVRTSVQDAIEANTRRAGAQLTAYEREVDALNATATELRDVHGELRAAELAAENGQAHLEVHSFFARWKYVVLIALLVVVDWVANVPVFSELLPKDPGADDAWRVIVAESETMGILGGPYRMAARALHNLDASLLALGVIVFLVFLAHVFGESLRRLLSHSAAETPTAAPTIRSQRRQFGVTAVLSFIGIAGVISVLWLARAQLERTTAQRVVEVDARIEAVQAQLVAAQARRDLIEVGTFQQQVEGLRIVREQRIERADYALIISRMNLPILLLNLVLAIAAAVAGYLVTRDSIRGALHSPRAAALRDRLRALHGDAAQHHAAMTRIDAAVAWELAMARYLASARPLRGWNAHADRLRAVIPTFRAENARRRGIDTASIAAFRKPAVLDPGTIDDEAPLTPPPELAVHRELHAKLRERAAAALARLQTETPASAQV